MLHKKILFSISIFALLFLLLTLSAFSIQKSLAKKVLRLHILANSNSVFDQELKLKVRDEVLSYLTPLLKDSKNLDETKNIVTKNLGSINELAQATVSKHANYKTYVSLDTSTFPTKYYSNIAFPAGKYEALKIEIGEAKGNNWWCVMFPPLCFTNSSAGTFEDDSQEKLKENLSNSEYELVNNYDNPQVKIKFKVLEWLNIE